MSVDKRQFVVLDRLLVRQIDLPFVSAEKRVQLGDNFSLEGGKLVESFQRSFTKEKLFGLHQVVDRLKHPFDNVGKPG
jgi:hypothetical protein